MVKIGPAFTDYVSESRIKHRNHSSNSIFQEFSILAPVFFLLLIFSILFLRLFYVQILRGGYYSNLSNDNRTRTSLVLAPRGIIYDRKGEPLVANTPVFKIGEKDNRKTISREEALSRIAKGEKVDNEIQREYLYKDVFAHVLGYVGQINEDEKILPQFNNYSINETVGKIGLEKQYEKLLHGTNGKLLYEVDAQGKIIRELGKQEPVAGEEIKTTLDVGVGKAAAAAMKDVKKGVVVASDPRTGGILAIYSKPSFDPNVFTFPKGYKTDNEYKTRESILLDGDNQPLLDRAISGVYPPGSTFKLVSAMAALEEGAVKKDTIIEDTGIVKIGDASFGNWYFLQYGKTDGSVDVVKAVSRSNDIYFYKAAGETGVTKISLWAKNFGLGEKLNIDLPGEVKGTVPTPNWKQENIGEQWYLGDTYNYGIGQGYLLTTPLQVNTFTTVFANDGTLYQPHLILGNEKVIKKNFVKKENIDAIREGMRMSCEKDGVAWPFFDFKVKNDNLPIDGKDFIEDASDSAKMVRVKVGCKTGTAETGGKDTNPHAWITVFAPFYNPEIVVTVLVENGGEGSSVAGPIARDVLKDYFENK